LENVVSLVKLAGLRALAMSENPTVIVLEDEMLIAMDVESILSDAGFNVATTTTCAEAESLLETVTPDAVVLDVHLSDGECVDFATKLVSRSIPFIVHTGAYAPTHHEIFNRGVVVEKPANSDELVAAVKSLLTSHS
jgi:DNA-binding response OmpR family regulator